MFIWCTLDDSQRLAEFTSWRNEPRSQAGHGMERLRHKSSTSTCSSFLHADSEYALCPFIPHCILICFKSSDLPAAFHVPVEGQAIGTSEITEMPCKRNHRHLLTVVRTPRQQSKMNVFDGRKIQNPRHLRTRCCAALPRCNQRVQSDARCPLSQDSPICVSRNNVMSINGMSPLLTCQPGWLLVAIIHLSVSAIFPRLAS